MCSLYFIYGEDFTLYAYKNAKNVLIIMVFNLQSKFRWII